MAKNRLIIGKDDERDKKDSELELLKKDGLHIPGTEVNNKGSKSSEGDLDDNLWGNDWQVNKSIDKDFMAEKRLFVRVRYFHPLECRMKYIDPDADPLRLESVLHLTMFDLSMGGIGAICEEPIPQNEILLFPLQLDHLTYDIKCQVVYCIPIDKVYRLGFRILSKDKDFIKHLKLFVARLSLIGSKISLEEIVSRYYSKGN